MTLNKDASIVDLLARLQLQERRWMTVDHWDADLCAIGIASTRAPRRLIYVSTFGKPAGRYDYECEAPAGPTPEEYQTIASGQDVGFDELLVVMQEHFES